MNDRDELSAVLRFERNVVASLPDLRLAAQPRVTFRREDAVKATILYFTGDVTVDLARSWARWVLGRSDVDFAGDPELVEFLQDWADAECPLDADTVDVWQSRLALGE